VSWKHFALYVKACGYKLHRGKSWKMRHINMKYEKDAPRKRKRKLQVAVEEVQAIN
jgi:hypothetical protein